MQRSYVNDLLSMGEVVLIDTRQHWVAAIRFVLRPLLLLGVALLLAIFNRVLDFPGVLHLLNDLAHWALIILIVVSVIWLPIDLVRWWSRHYVLTNRRAMRMEGVIRRRSIDSSLEHINDIRSEQSFFGRQLGYADLTIYTASTADEVYHQLLDGLEFKKVVLDAKEAIRRGAPLQELPPGLIIKGGTNEASMRADGKLKEAATQAAHQIDPSADPASLPAASGAEARAAERGAAAATVAASPVTPPPAEPEPSRSAAAEVHAELMPEPAAWSVPAEEAGPASLEAERDAIADAEATAEAHLEVMADDGEMALPADASRTEGSEPEPVEAAADAVAASQPDVVAEPEPDVIAEPEPDALAATEPEVVAEETEPGSSEPKREV